MTHENLMRIAKAYAEGLNDGLSDGLSNNSAELHSKNDELIRRKAVLALAKDVTLEGGVKHRCIDATKIYEIPSAESEYEPVTVEDFAKTMSENTIWGFMTWHGVALKFIEEMGFVICKKTM